MNRLLAIFPPFRWWRSFCALIGHARVHPQALLLGRANQVVLERGCTLGARVCVDPGSKGRVIFGKRVWIAADVEIQTDTRVTIGDGTTIQRRSTINGSTRLGRYCIIAPNVFISSGTHPFRFIPYLYIREQERRIQFTVKELAALDRPIWIQDDCWLGTNAVILPGVTIGKGSIVGANAVVTKDIPPYSVVAGAPAHIVGHRLDWNPPLFIDPSCEEVYPYLLDARLKRGLTGTCIEVALGSSMLVALKAPSDIGKLEIDWQAQQPVTINFRGRAINLIKGKGCLILHANELLIKDGITFLSLEVISTIDSQIFLEILKIKCVED